MPHDDDLTKTKKMDPGSEPELPAILHDFGTYHGVTPPGRGGGGGVVVRILSSLTRANPRRATLMAQAVIDIVAAVGYDQHPDLELPVPGDDFAERLAVAAIAASGAGQYTRTTDMAVAQAADAEDLPNRTLADRTAAMRRRGRRARSRCW